jgi:hypothetical protein
MGGGVIGAIMSSSDESSSDGGDLVSLGCLGRERRRLGVETLSESCSGFLDF